MELFLGPKAKFHEHEIPWNFSCSIEYDIGSRFRGILCSSLKVHRIPWNSIESEHPADEFLGIPWSFFSTHEKIHDFLKAISCGDEDTNDEDDDNRSHQ